jgi:hypothetical protein
MKTLMAATLLGGLAGIEDVAGHVRRVSHAFDRYGNQSGDGKRNRKPGIRKQRDKNKAARKARVANKGR